MSQMQIQLLPFSSQRSASVRIWGRRVGLCVALVLTVTLGMIAVLQMQIAQANAQIQRLLIQAEPTLKLKSSIGELDQQITTLTREYEHQQKLAGPPVSVHVLSLTAEAQQVVSDSLRINEVHIVPELVKTTLASQTTSAPETNLAEQIKASITIRALAKDDQAIETYISELSDHPAIISAKMTRIDHSFVDGEMLRSIQIEAEYRINSSAN